MAQPCFSWAPITEEDVLSRSCMISGSRVSLAQWEAKKIPLSSGLLYSFSSEGETSMPLLRTPLWTLLSATSANAFGLSWSDVTCPAPCGIMGMHQEGIVLW